MAKRRRRLYADLDRAMLIRAAKLARLPGVTRAEVCERFDRSIGMLRRALKDLGEGEAKEQRASEEGEARSYKEGNEPASHDLCQHGVA